MDKYWQNNQAIRMPDSRNENLLQLCWHVRSLWFVKSITFILLMLVFRFISFSLSVCVSLFFHIWTEHGEGKRINELVCTLCTAIKIICYSILEHAIFRKAIVFALIRRYVRTVISNVYAIQNDFFRHRSDTSKLQFNHIQVIAAFPVEQNGGESW